MLNIIAGKQPQTITRKFTFRKNESGLEVPRRTHNDLQQEELYTQAVASAEGTVEELSAMRDYMQSLDQTDLDHNKTPGSVLVDGVSFRGKLVEGTQTADATVLMAKVGDEVSRYEVRDLPYDTRFKRTSYTGQQLSEEIVWMAQEDGKTDYIISDRPESIPFKDIQKQADLPPTKLTEQIKLKAFGVGDDLLMKLSPPHNVSELRGHPNRQQELKEGNETVQKVRAVFQQALALDQSEQDLNPRPKEVLFKDAMLYGRKLTGSVRPLVEADGSISPRLTDAKYLAVYSPESGERFEGSFEDAGLVGPKPQKQEVYIHEKGDRRVEVDFHTVPDGLTATMTVSEEPQPQKSFWNRVFG